MVSKFFYYIRILLKDYLFFKKQIIIFNKEIIFYLRNIFYQ